MKPRVLALLIAALPLAIAGCRVESSSPPPAFDELTLRVPAAAGQTTTTTSPSVTPSTRPASLATRLEAILTRHRASGAIVGARFADAESGREIYAYDAARPMTPASNLKLLVAAAALDFFGPDATLQTRLLVAGQDLWVVGTGDPGAGDEPIAREHGRTPTSLFDDWAAELRARGVTRLAGNLYYVDDAFEAQQVHPSWHADDLTEWYAAPAGGLNLNGNCIDATGSPSTPGAPGIIDVEPPTSASIVMTNDTVTGGETSLEIRRAADQNAFVVSGTVARRTRLESKPVTDPGAFFADALRTHLAAHGVSIVGATRRGHAPPDAATTPGVLELRPATTSLVDVLWRIDRNSQNLFAECIAKYLGRAFARTVEGDPSAVGSWASANRAVRAFLARRGIDARDLRLRDGSGLSDENRVTAKLLTELLVAMYPHAAFATFRDSMTIAGTNGTNGTKTSRFADLPGRVFWKTGYIGGVRSLSGYARADSGRYLAFSIIYNRIPSRGLIATRPYEECQDDAVRTLVADPSAQ